MSNIDLWRPSEYRWLTILVEPLLIEAFGDFGSHEDRVTVKLDVDDPFNTVDRAIIPFLVKVTLRQVCWRRQELSRIFFALR